MKLKDFIVLGIIMLFLCGIQNKANATVVWGANTNVNFPFLGYFLDHTYTCVGNYDNCYTFPIGSSTSGGYVNVVGQATTSEASQAEYVGENCAETMEYGEDGVCHQHSNRVLDEANHLILDGSTIDGYSISVYFFGVYGACAY